MLQSYETAFKKIKEATEIEDIDLLVNKFIEVEDRNFALFNYVNELNNDIEMIQEQINEVRCDSNYNVIQERWGVAQLR